MQVTLVDPEVTRQKFSVELQAWKTEPEYRSRGWILLSEDSIIPAIEIAFLARIGMSTGSGPMPVVVSAVRLTYENYDLWPPSLTFIDAFTRQPCRPHVRAFLSTPNGPQDILIDGHPATNQPFICLPGIREYHSHPQHSGDDWMLHRQSKAGSLSAICDRIWRTMARNVIGLSASVQTLPVWPLQGQILIQITQGEFEGSRLPQAAGVKPQKVS